MPVRRISHTTAGSSISVTKTEMKTAIRALVTLISAQPNRIAAPITIRPRGGIWT